MLPPEVLALFKWTKKIPQGNSLLVFWELFLCIKAWRIKLRASSVVLGLIALSSLLQPKSENWMCHQPGCCRDGKGWEGQLMMNQVLQTKQGALSSWMSHSGEIQSTAHRPFSDNLTWKFKEVSGTFYGENCSTFHVFPASSWTRLSNKSTDQAKHLSRCSATDLISTPLTLTQA